MDRCEISEVATSILYYFISFKQKETFYKAVSAIPADDEVEVSNKVNQIQKSQASSSAMFKDEVQNILNVYIFLTE